MYNFNSVEELMKKIETLTIDPLRSLAREFNVVPGNKKRAELIEEIVGVYTGTYIPVRRRKTGRPTRNPSNGVSQKSPELTKEDIEAIEEQKQQTASVPSEENATGVLDIHPDGYGFLRTVNYAPTPNKDIYVPPVQIKRFGLRQGDKVYCKTVLYPDKTAPSLKYIFQVNDQSCENISRRPHFDSLLPCYPDQRITLEMDKHEYALRAIDLVAPVGKGQRGLIVAPPKAGKTILLKKIAQAVRHNHPDIHLTIVLIDERPEEVTDFKESVDCEVVYSTFDHSPQHHIQIAEMAVNNAKRRVEQGQDAMILLDSITRLGRAYNQTADQSGRTLTGGLDISALQEPKKLFGASRNVSGGGSLTIIATALIDTGSRMDDIIYEEFKGTGNMEIHLDRRMSEKRIFPAIDLAKSGTRREDLLLTQQQLEGMYLVRKLLGKGDSVSATEELLEMLTCSSSNADFIDMLKLITKKKAL